MAIGWRAARDRAAYIPTPEQIAAAAAEIRAGWTESERQKRTVGNANPQPWTPPQAAVMAVEADTDNES